MHTLRLLVAFGALALTASVTAQAPAPPGALDLEVPDLREELWIHQLLTATGAEAVACTSLADAALNLVASAARWLLDDIASDHEAEAELLCATSTQGFAPFRESVARYYQSSDTSRETDPRYCVSCTRDQQPWSEYGADTVGAAMFHSSFRGSSSTYPERRYHLLFLAAEAEVGFAPVVILSWPVENDLDPF